MQRLFRQRIAQRVAVNDKTTLCQYVRPVRFLSSLREEEASSSAFGVPQSASVPSAAVPAPKVVVVFGGNGFVGSRVCQAALSLGCSVTSINRSGAPSTQPQPPWIRDVKWVKADIFQPDEYAKSLEGATGCVSCVGAFGTDEYMEKICGEATVVAAETAIEKEVEHFVFISASGVGQSGHLILRGYFKGKKNAEDSVLRLFPDTGVCLRASGIYGDRSVKGVTIPLGMVMKPVESILSLPGLSELRKLGPLEAVFTPPVDVEKVARVAARAALGQTPGGILTVEDINRLADG